MKTSISAKVIHLQSEFDIQRSVVHHLEQWGKPDVFYWHTPNGERRRKEDARKLQKMGTRPGIADLLLIYNGTLFALEFKVRSARPTPEQDRFLEVVRSTGGETAVARTFTQALVALEGWGMLRIRVGEGSLI